MKNYRAFLLIASVLNVMNFEMCLGLKIAAFNVQNFGPTKMSKSDVVDILAQVDSYACVTTFLLGSVRL